MITDRDLEIIRYLEEYKYATIEQLEKIFFKKQQYSYNICRRRLIELKKTDYIKTVRDIATNKNIYMYNEDKIKPPNMHRILLLNVLAELKYCGYNVEKFEIEKRWLDGKFKSDAFTVFTVGNRRYHYFVEVQLSNNHHFLEKYDELYKTGTVQEYLGKDFFPRVLFISDRTFTDLKLEHTQIVTLDSNLESFSKILL